MTSRALNTPSAFPIKHSAFFVGHSEANPEIVCLICRVMFCQHLLAKWDEFLCRLLAMQSFGWHLPVTTLLTSGQDATCMLHQPQQKGRFIAEWLLRAALNVALDGSNDSTYLHHCVLDKQDRFFVLCGDFCFAHVSSLAMFCV